MKTFHSVLLTILFLAAGSSPSSAQWVHCSGADSLGTKGFAPLGTQLFAATVSLSGVPYKREGGVLVSADSGKTWTMLAGSPLISAIAVRDSVLYAGAFRSFDQGKSWAIDTVGMDGDSYVYRMLATDSSVFAATYGKLFRQAGTDTVWTQVGGSGMSQALARMGRYVFAGGSFGVLWRTSDEGDTWITGSACGYDPVSALAATDSTVFLANRYYNLAGSGQPGSVCLSRDTTKTWMWASQGLPRQFVGDPECPQCWTVYVPCFATNGENVFAGTYDGVYLYDKKSALWIPVHTGLPDTLVQSLFAWGDWLYAGLSMGGIWRRPLADMIQPAADSLVDCFPLSVGSRWEYHFKHDHPVDLDPGWWSITDAGKVEDLVVSKTDYPDSVLWLLRQTRNLHRSAGGTFVLTWDSTVVDTTTFALVELKADRHQLYLQRAIQDEDIRDFGADVYNYGFAFWRGLVDSLSVYRYSPVDPTGTALLRFYGINLHPASREIRLKRGVGLDSVLMRAYLTLDFTTASFKLLSYVHSDVPQGPGNSIPTGFTLFQNYPNPFNPTTMIPFSLPHRSHVSLTVFNTLGQKVAELVNGDIDAGYHEVLFNAGNLASGMYFYRMQAGPYMDVKRLLLIH